MVRRHRLGICAIMLWMAGSISIAGAAALVAILLTAGWLAYANRRPASPLPESTLQQSNSIQEQVPFGPAKLAPAKASTARTAPVCRVV